MSVTLKEERFLGLPKDTYSKVLGDDYVHSGNAVETIKFKSVSEKGAIVNYKQSCHLNKELVQKDEIKIQFPFRKHYVQAKMDRAGNIKKHIEIGEYNDAYFYFQMKHNFKFENMWLRLGAFHFGKKNQIGLRVESYQGKNFFSFRNIYKHDNTQVGCVGIFDFDKYNFSKFDTSASYQIKDSQLSLTHNANNLQLGSLKLGMSHKLNQKNQLAFSLSKNFAKDSSISSEFGVQSQCCKNLVSRFKINDQFKLSLSSKYSVDKNISLVGSCEIDFSKGCKAFDFTKPLFTPMGIQIDFNY